MFRGPILVLILLLATAAAQADTLRLANGDELNGEIIAWAVDHVVIDHPQLGRLRLSLEELDIDTGEAPNEGLFGTSFLRGWNRNISFGMNGKKGNNESFNLTAGFDFNYEDEFKRWLFTGRYFFNTDDGGDTDNNGTVDLRRDLLFPTSRWFAFTAFRYQYDQFESWQHRLNYSIGPGYHLIQREKHELDVRLGLAFTREFGTRDRNKGDGLFALDYDWKISGEHTLAFSNQLFFELVPDAGQIRNLTLAELRLRVTDEPKLNFIVGASNEYETDVEPGDEKNDLKYYISLGLDF